MRTPPGADEMHAPEFPPRMEWLNVAFLRMDRLMGRNVALVEFWDFARVHSLRTLPYLREWHRRYHDAGLAVIGVHSPGYSFGRDPAVVGAAVERLKIPYAVVVDSELAVWHLYGNRGWPARYLFDRRGVLRYVHFGEGDYLDCELAIQEALSEIDAGFEAPEPMEPLRPEDAPGVRLEPQTADIALPADAGRLDLVRDWLTGEDYLEAEDAGAAARFSYTGGGAYAVLSGADREPGLYEVEDAVIAEDPGLRLHAIQFTPAPP